MYCSDAKTATVKHYCISVDCKNWTRVANTYYLGGIRNPVMTVAECQSACFNNATCTGVDWFALSPPRSQCHLHGPSPGPKRSQLGVTHYRINRTCNGTSNIFLFNYDNFCYCVALQCVYQCIWVFVQAVIYQPTVHMISQDEQNESTAPQCLKLTVLVYIITPTCHSILGKKLLWLKCQQTT